MSKIKSILRTMCIATILIMLSGCSDAKISMEQISDEIPNPENEIETEYVTEQEVTQKPAEVAQESVETTQESELVEAAQESVEVSTKEQEQENDLVSTDTLETSPVGKIYIKASNIGDVEYTDIIISVDAVGGLSEAVKDVNARIKVRGNSSKAQPKLSYNIKFTEKISLLGMDSGKKWTLLATSYEKSLLRTPLAFTYAQILGLPYTSQFYFTELWVNGKYDGLYVLIEPVMEGKNRVDIDLKAGDFLIECDMYREEEGIAYIETKQGFRFELNEPETPTPEQEEAYIQFLNEAEAAIMTCDHTIYEQYIDIESFVNYYIFEEVTKNVDYGRFSTRYFCKDGKLYAGPPWDMDLTMGNVSRIHDEDIYLQYNNASGFGTGSGISAEGFWAKHQTWYQWLCEDEYFMGLVIKRWKEVLPYTINLASENELGISRIDYFIETYGDVIARNYASVNEGGAGWSLTEMWNELAYDEPPAEYAGHVELLRQWLITRIEWLDAEFDKMLQ